MTTTRDLGTIADQLAEYAATAVRDAHVPALAFGIVTESGLVETRAFGQNHAGTDVTADTLFEIGSATKAFLGVTEALLVDRGNLEWNDRVVDHLPDFRMHDPWVTRELRIIDLLAQRTGLPGYAAELPYFMGFSWADNVRGLAHVTPTTSFRSRFAYQNVPHFVAGQIVAEKLGVDTWNDAAASLLFTPLGMTSTGTAPDALAASTNSTRGHTMRDGAPHELPLADFPSIAEGAGSIVSNLTDMAKWVGMHLARGDAPSGRLISHERLDQTYEPLVTIDDPDFIAMSHHGTARPAIGYATGWFVHALPEGRVIEHGGNTDGSNAAVRFDPDRRVGLVVLSNQGFEGGVAQSIGRYGMDLLQGRAPLDYVALSAETLRAKAATAADARATNAGTQRPADAYAGRYAHPLLGTLEVRADGERLRTNIGPEAIEAVAERRSGRDFTLSWQYRGDPEAARLEYPLSFEDEGDAPRRLTLDHFVFDRV